MSISGSGDLAPNTLEDNFNLVTNITNNISKDIKVIRSSFDSTPYF